MHTHSLAAYVRCLERGDWQGVGELMLASAHKLAATGARFLICPDNTIHGAMPLVRARSPLPWLSIAQVVAARAAERGFRCVGLTGSRWLVASEVYPRALNAHGVRLVLPPVAACDEVSRIIMEELVRGDFRPESVAYVEQAIAGLKEQGCDAVVLGCTELPLIINERTSALPTLDSTRELARAALRRSAEGAG